jgi:uncharacterized repeat protein (TIGR03803 family)
MFDNLSSRSVLAAFFCFALICLLSAITTAQTYTVLYAIPNQASDVYEPSALAIAQGRNGDLYATAPNPLSGELFSATPAGVLTPLYNVGGFSVSGATLGTDGNLYGTTQDGGTNGYGIVYKVTPAGVETVLHDFDGTDGQDPYPELVQASNGLFYGVASTSTSSNTYGTIFSISSSGTFNVLHTFEGSDGQYPHSGLTVGSDGNFYGGTTAGGANGDGVLFKITPGGTYTVLYNLCSQANCADGYDMETPLVLASDGNLYGTTHRGGDFAGVFFKLTNGGAYTVVYTFLSAYTPAASALALGTDGALYGIMGQGNDSQPGWIYSITTSGTFTILHAFCQDTNCTDGSNPSTPLIQDTNGTFYGFTSTGGVSGQCNSGLGCGVFYSLNTSANPFITLSGTSGKVGSKVGIFGQGFSSSSVVKFNGVQATTVTHSGTTYLTATVPAGATDGYVTVTTGTTMLKSTKKYTVHDSWASGAVIPTPINYPAGTGAIGAKIYVVGGSTASGYITTNQVYNTAANSWSTEAALPTATAGGAGAVVKGILYIFGGYIAPSQTPTDAAWSYNPATNAWTALANMPTARGSITAAVDGTKIYVIGGNGSTLRLNTVEAYDTASNTWTEEAPLLEGKSEPASGLLGSTLVAADGYTLSGDNGDNESYAVSTNTWTSETSDPNPRNGACYGAVGSALYVAGGGNVGSAQQSINESYNLNGNKWTTLASMLQATIAPGSAVVSGQLYCIAGSSSGQVGGGTLYNNVQIYQP